MNGIKLPTYKARINTFPIYGAVSSIIPTGEEYEAWFYNNFIQLRYLVKDHILFFDQYRSLMFSCPYITTERISRDTIEKKWVDYCLFLKDKISEGRYVLLFCDRFAMSRYVKDYHVNHILHELFVIGYDDDKEVFHCMDNGTRGMYVELTIPYEEVRNSLDFTEVSDYSLYFSYAYCIKQEAWWDADLLDEQQILNMYEDYSKSKYRKNIVEPFTNVHYGFRVHYDVLDDLKKGIEVRKPRKDVRGIYLLNEHKKIMCNRFKSLYEMTSKSVYKSMEEKYSRIAGGYSVLIFKFLKCASDEKDESWWAFYEEFKGLVNQEKDAADFFSSELLQNM